MNETKVFPVLYGIDKNSKIKQWNIRVENKGTHSLIIYSYGYVNGRKVECTLTVSSGKNLGKRNQTTHFQQAVSDAQSKWTKKRDIDKYKLDQQELYDSLASGTDNASGNPSTSIAEGQGVKGVPPPPLPMLAQDYHKYVKKLAFPCYIQPKLDGYRMIYNPATKRMTTRTGKPFLVLPNTSLHQELGHLDVAFPLDGELYVHDSEFAFENYGVLRKQSYSKLTGKERETLDRIEYHIYDIIHPSMTFKERLGLLESIREKCGPHIKIVETSECSCRNDVVAHHQEFIKLEYEGSIVRNRAGVYRQKYRSYDLLKYKDFDDSEFKIVDFTFENDFRGTDEKPIIWVCENSIGQRFNVPSKGTRGERTVLYHQGRQYIGKMLWVQHFGWTSDGIPRFPKTMRNGRASIREIE
jgi:DNA ligase 1